MRSRYKRTPVNGPDLRTFLPVYAAAVEGDALGDLGARRLGVGKTAAAVALVEVLAAARPAGVLLFGVGGAYAERHREGASLRPGDVVVVGSDRLADEGVRTRARFLDLGALGLPSEGPFAMDAAATAIAAQRLAVRVVDGATVSTCSGTDELAVDLAHRTGAEVETMEGAAVALVCARHRVPLVHVRAISNWCGDRERGGWDLALAVGAVQRAVRRLLT